MPKDRAVCVCFDDGRVLLIRRVKNGRRYTVLPGGGVEDGETPAEAAVREFHEETGLKGIVVESLAAIQHDDRRAHYFRVTGAPGRLVLGGLEAALATENNLYDLLWVSVADLDDEPIVPAEAKTVVAGAYRLGI